MTQLPMKIQEGDQAPATLEALDNQLLQSLTCALGCMPTLSLSTRYPEKGSSFQVVCHVTLGGNELDALDDQVIENALAAIEYAFEPASRRELLKAVAVLNVRCKRRVTSAEDTKLAVNVMISDLSELPGDVALWVLDEWSRQSPWWPTRAELLQLAERKLQQRAFIKSRFQVVQMMRASQSNSQVAA
jgi:hypothetical protein